MLRFLLSRSNYEIEKEMFAQAIAAMNRGEEGYLLVPEQFTLQNELRLMDEVASLAVSKIRVMSFQRLALEALSKMGGLKRTPIDRLGKTMILKNILEENSQSLRLYQSSIEKAGFVDGLLRQLAELKRSQISPEDLRNQASTIQNAALLSQKLAELATIYEKFEQAIAGKYVDNEDRLGQLAELSKLDYLKNKKILIFSFLDFTAVERQIIRNLILSGAEISIGLCLDLQSARSKRELVFESTHRTYNQLSFLAHEIGEEYETIILDGMENSSDEETKPPALEHLSRQLFQLVPKKFEQDTDAIELFAAHFVHEEVEHIALQISKLVVEKNYRYKDFMVVAGDLATYSSSIQQIFGQFELPYFIDDKRLILQSPIIKVIVAAIKMLGGDFSTENIMVFLKNDFDNLGENAGKIYDFENYLLSKKLRNKMFLDDRFFVFEETNRETTSPESSNEGIYAPTEKNESEHNVQKTAYDGDETVERTEVKTKHEIGQVESSDAVVGINAEDKSISKYQAILDIRNNLLKLFLPFVKKAEGKHTAREYGELIVELLEQHRMLEKIQRLITDLRSNDLLDEANENNQVWNIFVRVLEQADEVFGEQEMSLAKYRELIVESLKSHKLAVIPPAQDQIIVGDVSRSRIDSKKIIYICGMNAGNIPKSYQESGILTQEEKSYLAENDLELPSEPSLVSQNEQLQIYNLLTRATEKLCLSYSTENAMPSSFITAIQETFPQLKIASTQDYAPQDYISRTKPTIAKLAKELKQQIKGETQNDLWQEVLTYYAENDAQSTQIALEGLFYDNAKKNISSASRIYPSPIRMSTTRLRSFEECPFKHFIQYGLRAKERKEYSIRPAEMGLVLHSTVEEVMRTLKSEPLKIDNITREQMDRLVEQYFDESTQNLLKEYDLAESRNQFFLRRMKKTAKQISYTSVEHLRLGKFELLAQEQKFDYGEKIPPIVLQIGEREIVLTGTIDRIDTLVDGERCFVKVVDYKTSNKEFSLSDAYHNLDIQLLVYLSAVLGSDKLIKNKKYPAGVFYFPITTALVETKERSSEELGQMIKEQIKMDGLVLGEEVVLQGLDHSISAEDKKSSIVYQSSKKNRITEQDFSALLDHIHKNIEESMRRMLDGEISAMPVLKDGKKDLASCRFCRYASICRFEEALGDRYRPLYKYKNEDILEKVRYEQNHSEKQNTRIDENVEANKIVSKKPLEKKEDADE